MKPLRKHAGRRLAARLVLARKRGSHRVARWAALALEALGASAHVWRPIRHNDFGKGRGRPVLLLHGFAAPRRILDVLERRLRADLGMAVMSFHLPGLGGAFDRNSTLQAEAERLARKLERLCERFGVTELDIVGHSKGGVVARYMVAHFPVGQRVRTLITLGSPFRGAPVAMAVALPLGAFSRSLWQLLPFSAFLRNLARAPLPPGLRLVSIASAHDAVAPAFVCAVDEALAPRGAVHNYVVSGVGHNGLLLSRRVYTIIADELRRPRQVPGT